MIMTGSISLKNRRKKKTQNSTKPVPLLPVQSSAEDCKQNKLCELSVAVFLTAEEKSSVSDRSRTHTAAKSKRLGRKAAVNSVTIKGHNGVNCVAVAGRTLCTCIAERCTRGAHTHHGTARAERGAVSGAR